ncbi:MAG TPA: efflux RND transporter periplasmic adaptor subunit [Candidatus Binataceae bacterium]|nr:efflux RND transporter periplasmic adaptor subunit [Candidatus Binataceae bacterium]
MEEDARTYIATPPGRLFYAGWIIVALIAIALTTGLVMARSLRLTEQASQIETQLASGPRVLVAPVTRSPTQRSLRLPANLHGYIETPVYAKVAGYLKEIRVDKGDRVTKGQVIAILESPELDQQVTNARANYDLAAITDRRQQTLLRQGVVAPQTADQTHAAMVEAKANLDQLVAEKSYEVITAPFDGIITARYVDPGQLIPQVITPAGTSTPVVAMATLAPLRVYIDTPQSLAPFIHDGTPATVTVNEYPGRKFEGHITRHPNALTAATRTMLTEIDLPNTDYTLYPGMYAMVDLKVAIPTGVPMVPDDALIFRDGQPFVPVVRNDHLKLAPVSLGYDNGVAVEVTEGITGEDMVALNVGQSAQDGEPVQPVTAEQASAQK